MTVEEFVGWAEAQPEGRFELVDGEPIRMAGEGGRHNLTKLRIARLLEDAVAAAGFNGVVFTDGMTVKINKHQAREPDALITAGPVADLDAMIIVDPLVVVEVISPTTQTVDTGTKLGDYFSVSSIAHYLIVHPTEKFVIHHARGAGDLINTRIVRSGTITLDPPGLMVPVDGMLVAD